MTTLVYLGFLVLGILLTGVFFRAFHLARTAGQDQGLLYVDVFPEPEHTDWACGCGQPNFGREHCLSCGEPPPFGCDEGCQDCEAIFDLFEDYSEDPPLERFIL
jgi:hypothetical protein